MNSRFQPNRVLARVNANARRIESEIPQAFNRWGKPNGWVDSLQRFTDFFEQRPAFVREHIVEQFGLAGHHPVAVVLGDTAAGYVEINSLSLTEPDWCGRYFEGVPIRVKAVAKAGHTFDRWEGFAAGRPVEFTIDVVDSVAFTPVFRAVADGRPSTDVVWEAVRDVVVTPNPVREGGYAWLHHRVSTPASAPNCTTSAVISCRRYWIIPSRPGPSKPR